MKPSRKFEMSLAICIALTSGVAQAHADSTFVDRLKKRIHSFDLILKKTPDLYKDRFNAALNLGVLKTTCAVVGIDYNAPLFEIGKGVAVCFHPINPKADASSATSSLLASEYLDSIESSYPAFVDVRRDLTYIGYAKVERVTLFHASQMLESLRGKAGSLKLGEFLTTFGGAQVGLSMNVGSMGSISITSSQGANRAIYGESGEFILGSKTGKEGLEKITLNLKDSNIAAQLLSHVPNREETKNSSGRGQMMPEEFKQLVTTIKEVILSHLVKEGRAK